MPQCGASYLWDQGSRYSMLYRRRYCAVRTVLSLGLDCAEQEEPSADRNVSTAQASQDRPR